MDFSKGAPASKPCRNQWTLKHSKYPLGTHRCQLPHPGTREGLAFPGIILPVSIFNQQSSILRCTGLSIHYVLACFDWHITPRGTCVLFIPVLLMLTSPLVKGWCHPGLFSTLALVNSNKWFVGRLRLCWHPVSDEFFSASCSVHWWLSPFRVWGRHLLWGWALPSHLHICQYGVMDSFFIQWVAIPLSSFFIVVVAQVVPDLVGGSLFKLQTVSLQAVSFCYVFLIPWTLP